MSAMLTKLLMLTLQYFQLVTGSMDQVGLANNEFPFYTSRISITVETPQLLSVEPATVLKL